MRSSLACLLAATALLACGGDDAADPDAAAPDAPAVDAPIDAGGIDAPFVDPTMLSQTGLYSDIATKTIAPGIIEYVPRWELWSDDAVKRRWIWLPPGTQIDTTADMDFWSFPTGTKLWKEFSRGGARIETRLLEKHGLEDDVASWFMVSFQWDAAETDATAVPGGVVDDTGVNDIPARSQCRQCHGNNRSPTVILGFQALQLDYDATGDGMDLGKLVQDSLLTLPPGQPVGESSFFPFAEDSVGSPVLPALGYLHANCGSCHNLHSDVKNTVDLELRLSTATAARQTWAASAPYAFAVNVEAMLTNQGTHVVRGMDTTESALFNRMTSTVGGIRMPPIGRETPDTAAIELVRAWIDSLPAPN